jgi:hypothetical protein
MNVRPFIREMDTIYESQGHQEGHHQAIASFILQ